MARKGKKGSNDSKAMIAVLPGEGQVEPLLLDEAVADLNRIYVSKGLETARAVGDYALAKFFKGDPANFKDRANGHISFRELGKREDLQLGWQFIWNAVAVVTQAKSLPAAVAEVLPLSHHKLLLTVKNDETRIRLAEEAASEGLSKRDFEERVKQARPAGDGGSKAGRPPLPAFVKAFTGLKKVVEVATSEVISEASFDHFSKEEAEELLAEMDNALAMLTVVVANVRQRVKS